MIVTVSPTSRSGSESLAHELAATFGQSQTSYTAAKRERERENRQPLKSAIIRSVKLKPYIHLKAVSSHLRLEPFLRI